MVLCIAHVEKRGWNLAMADGGEAGGDSQGSSLSNFSFDLSQDTLNQVMSAVGMQGLSGAEGDR